MYKLPGGGGGGGAGGRPAREAPGRPTRFRSAGTSRAGQPHAPPPLHGISYDPRARPQTETLKKS